MDESGLAAYIESFQKIMSSKVLEWLFPNTGIELPTTCLSGDIGYNADLDYLSPGPLSTSATFSTKPT